MIISFVLLGLAFTSIYYIDNSATNNTVPVALASQEASQEKIIGYEDDGSLIRNEELPRDAEIEYVAPE